MVSPTKKKTILWVSDKIWPSKNKNDHQSCWRSKNSKIIDDPELNDYHEAAKEHLSKVECVIGLTNTDLSVIINGKMMIQYTRSSLIIFY